MSSTFQPMTGEDLLRMPDDEFRYELVKGELRKTSPGGQKHRRDKVLEWLEAGSRMVVLVNPRKEAVTVYRSLTDIAVLTEKDILDGGEVVPGWTMAVKEIFD